MSNERPDDATLRHAYRQIASEKTPAHLDMAVLDMAAKHARRPGYSRSIKWTRPLAWAATIALCLAITLEITRLPAPEAVPATPASLERSLRKESQPASANDEKQNPGRSAARPAAETYDNAPPVDLPAMHDDEAGIKSEAKAGTAPARKDSLGFEVQDADMVKRAAEQARLQRGSNLQIEQEETRIEEGFASDLAAPAGADCTEDDRSDPVSWLACIESLDAAGDADAAAAQRDQLRKAFPDFDRP